MLPRAVTTPSRECTCVPRWWDQHDEPVCVTYRPEPGSTCPACAAASPTGRWDPRDRAVVDTERGRWPANTDWPVRLFSSCSSTPGWRTWRRHRTMMIPSIWSGLPAGNRRPGTAVSAAGSLRRSFWSGRVGLCAGPASIPSAKPCSTAGNGNLSSAAGTSCTRPPVSGQNPRTWNRRASPDGSTAVWASPPCRTAALQKQRGNEYDSYTEERKRIFYLHRRWTKRCPGGCWTVWGRPRGFSPDGWRAGTAAGLRDGAARPKSASEWRSNVFWRPGGVSSIRLAAPAVTCPWNGYPRTQSSPATDTAQNFDYPRYLYNISVRQTTSSLRLDEL